MLWWATSEGAYLTIGRGTHFDLAVLFPTYVVLAVGSGIVVVRGIRD